MQRIALLPRDKAVGRRPRSHPRLRGVMTGFGDDRGILRRDDVGAFERLLAAAAP